MKPYPEYKPTGLAWLSEIPKHWKSAKLRNLLSIVSKKNHPEQPLLSVVREKGVIRRDVDSKEENHNYIPEDLSNYKVVRKGQFAMNKMKAWQGSYGISQYDGIVSPAYFVFDLHGVSADFFNIAIRSKAYIPYFAQASDGIRVGQWDLSLPRMHEIPFFIPPADEQAQIVRYLDAMTAKINKLIRAKKRQIALLQEQKQAIINQAVTRGLDPEVELKDSGIDWLGPIPKHWIIQRLSLRYYVQLGKMLDTKKNSGESSVSYLRNQDVQWGKINVENLPAMDIPLKERERFLLAPNDLLVCEGGEIGRCAIWTHHFPCYYQKALIRLRSRNKTKDYVYFLEKLLFAATKANAFSFQTGKSTIAHLPAEKLSAFRIMFPPIKEQVDIVDFLDKKCSCINQLIHRNRYEIGLATDYKNSLIAAVVTGKVDVRNIAVEVIAPEDLAPSDDPDESEEQDSLRPEESEE